MPLDRRAFLAGASGALLATLGGSLGVARGAPHALFASCAADQDGGYSVSGFDLEGRARFAVPLPVRGHAAIFHPAAAECVVFARRPGRFLVAVDCALGAEVARIQCAAGRRFQGHGAFSADGRHLFAAENDYEAGRGLLGIYDADSAYQRIGEIPSHGVGPHDVRLLPDGSRLVVANGGIRTHPDYGRAKLNVATMDPNLAILDVRTGALLDQARPPKRLHKLSLRHLDVSREGRVAIAMQYEGDRRHRVPLVGCYLGSGTIDLFQIPSVVERRMRHYTGSIAFDSAGGVLAASSPRGHVITLWDVTSGAFLRALKARDSSGIAATGRGSEFLVSGGDGKLRLVDARTGESALVTSGNTDLRWDNHISALPGYNAYSSWRDSSAG